MDADLANILVGFRTWLKAAGAAAGLTDAQVIVADQNGPRPPLPYATVRVTSYDLRQGSDEEFVDASDPPQFRQRGVRTGSVSVNVFGRAGSTWLRRAVGRLRHPSIKRAIDALGLTIEPLSGLNNLTSLRDTSMEPRFQRDFSVLYRTISDAEAVVELETVAVTGSDDLPSPTVDLTS